MLLYSERQKVSPNCRVICILTLLVFMGLYILKGEFFLTFLITSLSITILSLFLKFDFNIYEDRIEYRLYPFHFTNRIIESNLINKIEVVYLKQRGVYGYKIKRNHKGMIYFFGSSDFLRILTKNKKLILISTNNKKKLSSVLSMLDASSTL